MTIKHEGHKRDSDQTAFSVVCFTCPPVPDSAADVSASTFDSLSPSVLKRKSADQLAKRHEKLKDKTHRLVVTGWNGNWGGGRNITKAELKTGRVQRDVQGRARRGIMRRV